MRRGRVTLILLLCVGALAVPAVVLAQGGGSPITFPNPIAPTATIGEVITKILVALRDNIAPPIVAGMIIFGAFQILTSGGEPEMFTTGKRTILWAVIGYGIVIIATGIDSVIRSVLD